MKFSLVNQSPLESNNRTKKGRPSLSVSVNQMCAEKENLFLNYWRSLYISLNTKSICYGPKKNKQAKKLSVKKKEWQWNRKWSQTYSQRNACVLIIYSKSMVPLMYISISVLCGWVFGTCSFAGGSFFFKSLVCVWAASCYSVFCLAFIMSSKSLALHHHLLRC